MEKNKEITGSIWNKDNVQNISTITIRVCGADKVGKTCFIRGLVRSNKEFSYNKCCLESDFSVLKLNYDEEEIILKLWEGEATHNYNALFILYDVTRRDSFEEAIKKLMKERNKHPKVPIMLIANKTDLINERSVMEYEGEMNAIQYQTLFNENNSKNHSLLQQCLNEFIRSIL